MKPTHNRREKPLVLVADDDVVLRIVVRELLEMLGFGVEEAEDGPGVLTLIKESMPDLLLIDVSIPELDGIALTRSLRLMPQGEHVPVLLMSAPGELESADLASLAGPTDFMAKPLDWMILCHRVRYIWQASLAYRELMESRKEAEALIDTIPDMFLRIDRDGKILSSKVPREFHPLGARGGLEGKNIIDALYIGTGQAVMKHIEKAVETGQVQSFECEARPERESRHFKSRLVATGKDELLAVVRDITELKRAEEKIANLVYYDTLTGLLNRHSFKEQLKQLLAQSVRHDRFAAMLLLDLDRFKLINDSLGHWLGDLLLQAVAERVSECVRRSDCAARVTGCFPTNPVARLGGDEFSILLMELKDSPDAAKVANRVLEALSRPFILKGREIRTTASIGIAIYPFDGTDPDTLLRSAEIAMYHAKSRGRNNCQFFRSSMNSAVSERLDLESKLRKAIRCKEFLLHYQSQLDIRTGRIVGAEALIRWQHPFKGLISPMEFIPLAEETGLIAPIGDWVLRSACEQGRLWQMEGHKDVRVTVNLSSRQFQQKKSLVESVRDALDETRLAPPCLELELTERAIMINPDEAAATLQELKDMGLRIAIDDFGTGYSSLSYLKKFPLDVLKIDRSFVKDIPSSRESTSIATAIIAMAHSMDMRVVAEGVETEEQLAFLREHGCDEMQGFLFSPAVSSSELKCLLHEGKGLYAGHKSIAPTGKATSRK